MMKNRFEHETKLHKLGVQYVFGCDEAGRGPLAGPVVSAAVMFKKDFSSESWWHEILDSKLLSSAKREKLNKQIRNNSYWAISVVGNKAIDEGNILKATFQSMRKSIDGAIKKSSAVPAHSIILIDGKSVVPDLPFKQEAIITGDKLVHSIAAASILAKVHRDLLMQKLHQSHPQYGFNSHKGYGTKKHIEAIKQHGLSPVHRKSFCGKIL